MAAMAQVQFSWRNAVVPALVAVAIVLRLKWSVSPWILALFLVPILLYLFYLPRWIEKRLKWLDREMMRLLAVGKGKEILPLCRARTFLNLMAPKSAMAARLAFAHATSGDFRRAAAFYEEAIDDPELAPDQRAVLELGLGRAYYQLGEDRKAEEVYKRFLKQDTMVPEAALNLASIMIRNNRAGKEAERLLNEAEQGATTPVMRQRIRLARAEHAMERRQWSSARTILEGMGKGDLDPQVASRLEALTERLATAHDPS